MTNKPSERERVIAEILNGETSVYVRCGVELGYDRGYKAGVEAAARESEGCTVFHGNPHNAIAAAILALKEKP